MADTLYGVAKVLFDSSLYGLRIFVALAVTLAFFPWLGGDKLIAAIGATAFICLLLSAVVGIFANAFEWVEKRYGR